jgi:hypothetical protein
MQALVQVLLSKRTRMIELLDPLFEDEDFPALSPYWQAALVRTQETSEHRLYRALTAEAERDDFHAALREMTRRFETTVENLKAVRIAIAHLHAQTAIYTSLTNHGGGSSTIHVLPLGGADDLTPPA